MYIQITQEQHEVMDNVNASMKLTLVQERKKENKNSSWLYVSLAVSACILFWSAKILARKKRLSILHLLELSKNTLSLSRVQLQFIFFR